MAEKIDDLKLADLISSRRTIHRFRTDFNARDKLDAAIDLARWAPNHHLTEPWHFYVLGKDTAKAMVDLNTEVIRELKGDAAAQAKRRRWLDVPSWFVVTCAKSDDPLKELEDYAACCCAIQNVLLVLWNHEVGVKWHTGTLVYDKRFNDLLWIDPQLEKIVGLFAYGYAEDVPKIKRKPVVQFVTESP